MNPVPSPSQPPNSNFKLESIPGLKDENLHSSLDLNLLVMEYIIHTKKKVLMRCAHCSLHVEFIFSRLVTFHPPIFPELLKHLHFVYCHNKRQSFYTRMLGDTIYLIIEDAILEIVEAHY